VRKKYEEHAHRKEHKKMLCGGRRVATFAGWNRGGLGAAENPINVSDEERSDEEN